MRRHHIILPLAALLVVLPLLTAGCSCGHDFDFHLQSWLDATEQFRHGTLNPHWAFSAAFNAGEPRFVFYPPLSWTLGAVLTMLLPISLATTAYTFLALTLAGFTMYRLASHFASPNAALLAAALYMANPYMLFTAFERTAFAELLAAAWLPLLFLAVLRTRPTTTGIALPVALLWLTNAPAAVMGCYAMAFIVAVRLILSIKRNRRGRTDGQAPTQLFITTCSGAVLGLALAAFYLIPAAYERRFVQIAMAIIPNMRFQDNFLFGHTEDGPHNVVLRTASLLAVELLAITTMMLTALYFRARPLRHVEDSTTPRHSLHTFILFSLALLTGLIAFLLTPLSTPLWNHVPELSFLQFPWRLLSVIAVVLAFAVALIVRTRVPCTPVFAALAFVTVAALTLPAIHIFRQPCEDTDIPRARLQRFQQHQGVEPTDEYTPNEADNDVLRADEPPYWLATDPSAFAPSTTPNPATLSNPPSTQPATNAIALASTARSETAAPFDFTIESPSPAYLILNLRRYPAWRIAVNGAPARAFTGDARDDGLFVVPVDAGASHVSVHWTRALDETGGIAITLLALVLYLSLTLTARSRRIEV